MACVSVGSRSDAAPLSGTRWLAIVVVAAAAVGCTQPVTTRPPPTTLPSALSTQPAPGTTQPYRIDARIKELASLCRSRYATIRDYEALFTKDEVVPRKGRRTSRIRLRFRERPWSIHMHWIAGHDRHKQAIYVEGRYENKLQIKAGHMLFAPRLSLPLDHALVRQASRRSIRDAGVGNLVGKLVMLAKTTDPSIYGPIQYVGVEKVGSHGDLDVLCQHAKDIPGGKRIWYISRSLGLPVLIQTFDRSGKRIGFYEYRDFQFNIGLTDDDLDPDKVYK